MKRSHIIPALLATLLLSVSAITQAQAQTQTAPLTREQVKMDRDTFLSMFRWNESTSDWVLKDGMAPPKGVKSREEIKAMRDEFLSMNYWDELSSQFLPVKGGKPREMSKLTRDQVKMETEMFLQTHRFEESTSTWVAKAPAKKKG